MREGNIFWVSSSGIPSLSGWYEVPEGSDASASSDNIWEQQCGNHALSLTSSGQWEFTRHKNGIAGPGEVVCWSARGEVGKPLYSIGKWEKARGTVRILNRPRCLWLRHSTYLDPNGIPLMGRKFPFVEGRVQENEPVYRAEWESGMAVFLQVKSGKWSLMHRGEAKFASVAPYHGEGPDEVVEWTQSNAESLRVVDSSGLGIAAEYILGPFQEVVKKSTGQQNPNFHDIAPCLAIGEHGVGCKKLCPRDGRMGCSIVDGLADSKYKGVPTHFLSWVWSYTLATFAGAIDSWIASRKLVRKDVFLWCCFFCNNQYRILDEKSKTGSEDLEWIFEHRLKSIGKIVILLDTLREPEYINRVWCVFETFIAFQNKVDAEVILPSVESASFQDAVKEGNISDITMALSRVDVQNAKASEPADERLVKDKIKTLSSFDDVNRVVKENLIAWCMHEVKSMMENASGICAARSPQKVTKQRRDRRKQIEDMVGKLLAKAKIASTPDEKR